MLGACVPGEWNFQSVSEDRHLPWFTDSWQKTSHFRFWLAGLGELGGCFNLHPPIRATSSDEGLRSEPNHLLHILVKLKFGIAFVQKDFAKITTSGRQSLGFQKSMVSCVQLTWTDLLSHSWLQAWPKPLSLNQERDHLCCKKEKWTNCGLKVIIFKEPKHSKLIKGSPNFDCFHTKEVNGFGILCNEVLCDLC